VRAGQYKYYCDTEIAAISWRVENLDAMETIFSLKQAEEFIVFEMIIVTLFS